MFRIADGREHFYQWDLDRQVIISDPTITEVHFCNRTGDCSLVVEVKELAVFADLKESITRYADVPNILLQTDWPINVYAYCGTKYTKVGTTFKVLPRTKPDDYVYTETEVKRWEDLEKRVNTTLDGVAVKEEERAAAEAERAENEEARQAAEINRVDAEEARNTLFTTKMEELVIDEQTIEEHEKRITQLEHHLSDDYFITDETVAYRKPIAADACPYIQLNSVGGMTYKCSNLIPFPYTNGGANSSITIKGITYTVNADGSIVANGTANGKSAFNLVNVSPLPAETTYDSVTMSGCPAGGSTNTYYFYCLETGHKEVGSGVVITGFKGKHFRFSLIVESGVTVTNLVFKPMVNFGKTALPYEPYYEGLRDSKVTAIRNHGANLAKMVNGTYDLTAVYTVAFNNGHLRIDRKEYTAARECSAALYFQYTQVTLPAGTYTFKANNLVNSKIFITGIYVEKSDGTRLVNGSNLIGACSFTLPAADTIRWGIYTYEGTEYATAGYIECDIMINAGTTAAEYKPYREPITYTIPEAIQGSGKGVTGYADTVDFERGKYIKKCETYVFTGNETWTDGGNGRMVLSDANSPLNKPCIPDAAICDSFNVVPYTSITSSPVGSICVRPGGGVQCMTSFTNNTDWKAYLASNPITLIYALATPIETELPEAFENIIEVEAGGSLEFINEYKNAVPSSLTYLQKEGSI